MHGRIVHDPCRFENPQAERTNGYVNVSYQGSQSQEAIFTYQEVVQVGQTAELLHCSPFCPHSAPIRLWSDPNHKTLNTEQTCSICGFDSVDKLMADWMHDYYVTCCHTFQCGTVLRAAIRASL